MLIPDNEYVKLALKQNMTQEMLQASTAQLTSNVKRSSERRGALLEMRKLAGKHFREIIRLLDKEIYEENIRLDGLNMQRESKLKQIILLGDRIK